MSSSPSSLSSSRLIDRSPSGDHLRPPTWGKQPREDAPPPCVVPVRCGGGAAVDGGGGGRRAYQNDVCGFASWPSSVPSPTDCRVGDDGDVRGMILGHGGGIPAKDGEGLETRLPHHGRTLDVEVPRANHTDDKDVTVEVCEERGFEDDADVFSSLGHFDSHHHQHQPRQSSAEQLQSHQTLRPEHSNCFLGSVDSHNGPSPAPTDPALPPVAAIITAAVPTTTTTPAAPLWEALPPSTNPLGAAAGGGEVVAAAAAAERTSAWTDSASALLGRANTTAGTKSTTALPGQTLATTTLEPQPPTLNRDTTTSSRTARLERSRLLIRTPLPSPQPSQSEHCHESQQQHTYDFDGLNNLNHNSSSNSSNSSNNSSSSRSSCNDPAFSPSTAASATSRKPPTTPPPTLPSTTTNSTSERCLPLLPRSRDAMGHGLHEPHHSVVLLPNSTPSGLSVSVVVSQPPDHPHSSLEPLSPLPQSDMEPHERYPVRDSLHNNNNNNSSSSNTERSPASCGPTNEGKHRDSGDWDESRNGFDNDDDTVTVQSFDSATVVASPALMPQIRGEPATEAEENDGVAFVAPSLWANPPPTDREGALEATPTTSSSTTDLDTDDASLGDLMSLERSFLLEETQALADDGDDEPSFLLLDGDVASPVNDQRQHHHRRFPSWEGLLPRAAPYQGTVSYDDHDLARLFHAPTAATSSSLSPPPPSTTSASTPWPSQQRVTSFRASHGQQQHHHHHPYHPHQHSHSGGGGGGGNSFGSFGYQDRYTEPTGWQQPTTTMTQHPQSHHQRHHSQQQQQQMFLRASPPVPFLPPGRGTPPIDNRAGGISAVGGTRTYHHQPYPPHHHPYQQQQQQHSHHPYPPQQQQQHPFHPQHPHQPSPLQQQSQSPSPRMPGYGPHAQMSPSVGATPPRRGPPRGGQPPPSPGPHRPGYGGSSGGGPVPSLAGGGAQSAALAGGGGARSASEVLKTLLRKKACLYEADTSRAVALVTWLVGRELALERGYFSRQQLQAGVHACVANKIDAGVITRTKVNRCMQIILNSCFHYIIPRPDGTEESGESFGRIFAAEADDDSVLLQILPDPWTQIVVDRERVLQAAEQADWEAKNGAATATSSSSGTKKGSEFVTPQSSPRLTSATPDKGSPGGRDSLDGDDGTKRAVLLCFNENVRRAEDVFRCHNEFIRDTAHGSHLQLSSHEWRSFFGAEAAAAPHLWGNVGIPVPCNEESHGRSRVDALGMMTPDEAGKFRSTWCTKRYEHDHDLCGFAHVEVNGGWLRRNPLLYQYKDELCSFVSTITDKHTGQVLFVINECPRGTECELAHSSEEMMYHPRRYKMRACPASGRPGGCGLGDVCPNFHPTDTYRFPKKSEGRSSRHSKYSHAAGAAKGGPPTTPSGAPILMASPAPLSSFEEHLHLPGLRNLYRRQCSVVRAHLRQRGSTCVYGYFGDDAARTPGATVVPDDARTAPAPPVVRGLPSRA